MALEREVNVHCRSWEIAGLPISGAAEVLTRAELGTSVSSQDRDEEVGVAAFGGKSSSLVWSTSFVVEIGDPVPLGASIYRVTGLVRDEEKRRIQRARAEERLRLQNKWDEYKAKHPGCPPKCPPNPPIPPPPAMGGHPCDFIRLRIEEHPDVQLSAGSIVMSDAGMTFWREEDWDPERPPPTTPFMTAVYFDGVRAGGTGEVVADLSWQLGPLNFWESERGRLRPNPGLPVHRITVRKDQVITIRDMATLKVTAVVAEGPRRPPWVVFDVLRPEPRERATGP